MDLRSKYPKDNGDGSVSEIVVMKAKGPGSRIRVKIQEW